VLALLCGAVAWLAAPAVRATLTDQGAAGIGDAVAANLGGWLAAVAFVRGIAHAKLPADPGRIANVLGIAVPGLAALAIVGGMVSEPHRSVFLAEAQADVLLFLVAGILSLALARLGLVATGAAVDWCRNPAWLALVLVLLLGTAAIAVAAAVFAGPAIAMALGAVFAPLLVVGFFVGFDRRSLGILALSVLGTAAVAALLQLFASNAAAPPSAPPTGALPLDPDVIAPTPVTIGVLGVLLALAVLALLILARLWLQRTRVDEPPVPETREIDHGDWERTAGARRRRGLFRRRPTPVGAAEAYRRLLDDIDDVPAVRRLPGETPPEHAARLRRAGAGGLDLELLAADYGLARFGGVTLTPREERRGLARATALRRRLTRR
jgi:hypothetical protein